MGVFTIFVSALIAAAAVAFQRHLQRRVETIRERSDGLKKHDNHLLIKFAPLGCVQIADSNTLPAYPAPLPAT